MLVKKEKKRSIILLLIVFVIIFYYMMRVTTFINVNGGNWSFESFSIVLNELYKINTPLNIQSQNIAISGGVSFFVFMIYETYRLQNKRNVQENTYGSAEWKKSKDIKNKRDKDFNNNMILTQTELISRNMKISGMNRHVILLGRPGTRKISILF